MEASQASAESRRAALAAAAALIGPSIPGGIVNRKPGEAATASLTLAEMFLPWLEGGIRGPLYSDSDLLEDQVLGFQVVAAQETEDIGEIPG